MSLQHSPKIITDGLVLCLDAGSRKSYPGSGTVWSDLAGSNNGTLTNGPTFSSANGGSIVFDGVNDYIAGGNTSIVNNFYTISTWFRSVGPPSNNDGSGGFIFAQSSNYDHGIIISHSWLNQRIVLSSNINNGLLTSDNTALNNTIINAVGTYDGSKQRIYINGTLTAERNFSTAPVVVSPAFQVGRWGFGSFQRYCNANIYSVFLYNRALTAPEIQQNYNATKGRFNL